MSAVVIATYKVKPENLNEFILLIREKRNYFLQQAYVTKRPALLLQSKIEEDYFIEIFEWKTELASLNAHKDEKVIAFWIKMGDLWDDGGFGIDKIPEANLSFPHFEPLDIYYED
ncbi:MAG: hypothetical protein H0V01_14520 [Bacteroidetes bacterium]|nr:hypothetical protein [Bacteroidota bacterium]HET6245048.1 hypothetical protein [Bacteroidia bacterium]